MLIHKTPEIGSGNGGLRQANCKLPLKREKKSNTPHVQLELQNYKKTFARGTLMDDIFRNLSNQGARA